MARTTVREPSGGFRGKEFGAVVALVGGVLLLQLAASTIAGVNALKDARDATDEIYTFAADATADRVLTFIDPAEFVAETVEQDVLGWGFWQLPVFPDIEDFEEFPPPGFDDDPAFLDPYAGEPATADDLTFDLLFSLMAPDEQVTAVIVAFPDDSAFGVSRVEDDWYEYRIDPGADEPYVRIPRGFGYELFPAEAWDRRAPFTGAPWFDKGSDAAGSEWLGLAPSELRRGPSMILVRPIRHSDGELVAVVRVEVHVGEMADFLSELPLGEGGEAFVLSEQRGIIAAPAAYNDQMRALPLDTRPGPGGHDSALLGITEPAPSQLGVVHDAGGYTVLEVPLDEEGSPPWSLHLRAPAGSIAPGISSFQNTMLTYSIVIGAIVILGALVIVLLRGPLARLRERAARDHLTGLLNRHELMSQGTDMLNAAERRGGTIAVAMFDLDNFKAINDAHGHDTGDEVLVNAARALERSAGPRDVVGRFGGDEFTVVMWLDGRGDPAALVEKIRARLEAELRADGGDMEDVGASAGFAVSGLGINDLGALFSAADDALVAGKSVGKGATYPAQ